MIVHCEGSKSRPIHCVCVCGIRPTTSSPSLPCALERWLDPGSAADVASARRRRIARTSTRVAARQPRGDRCNVVPTQSRGECRMSVAMKWDTREYQRIASVDCRNNELSVQFEDGSRALIEVDLVLPSHARDVDWGALSFDSYQIRVPAATGPVEIPWSALRALTDREYATHLTEAAQEQARQIGQRIRELRKSRNLSSRELAERAGITQQSLSRIEQGNQDVVFATLQRVLSAMDCSLRDLTFGPGRQSHLDQAPERNG